MNRPNPEVSQIAKRRRFWADYKLKVLRETDACSQVGEASPIHRGEGLYASHLSPCVANAMRVLRKYSNLKPGDESLLRKNREKSTLINRAQCLKFINILRHDPFQLRHVPIQLTMGLCLDSCPDPSFYNIFQILNSPI